MGTYKTKQDIKDEDAAWAMNGLLSKAPLCPRVDADMGGTFTLSLRFLDLTEVRAILKLLEDHHKEWHG